jgi:hypothetical protein
MKRIITILIVLSFSSIAFSQTKMFINKTSGTDSLWLSDVKSITFKIYSTSSSTIYSENFATNPKLSLNETPKPGDTYIWDSTSGVYKIHLTETVPWDYKYVVSPQFTKIKDTSFTFQIDVKPISMSFGMGMQVHFFDSDSGIDKPAIDIGQTGTDNPLIIFYDTKTNYRSAATTMGTWYTISVKYYNSTKTADLKVVNTSTSQVFYQQLGVSFIIKSFNRIGIGSTTGAGDGSTAEMWYDNISLKYN